MSPQWHGYAPFCAKHLSRFVGRSDVTLLEIGILRSSGLAIWADLFPDGWIAGLDIDLSHVRENLPNLKALGAFSKGDPHLGEFDQFNPDPEAIRAVLSGRKADIVIDDGLHTGNAIKRTFEAVRPLLADNSVYFVEDYTRTRHDLASMTRDFKVRSDFEITAIYRR